jgi:hypothetical protein
MVGVVEGRQNRGGRPIDKSWRRHNRLFRLRLISQGLVPWRADKLKIRFRELKR